MKKKVIISLIVLLITGILLFMVINKDTSDSNPQTDTTTPEVIPPPPEPPKAEFPENIKLTTENIGVPVLYYHSVEPSEANEVIISPDKLKMQLQYLLDEGYYPITLSQLYEHLTNDKAIPEKSIVITFDDGYQDNYTNAFPILKELDINATIFVISDVLNNGYYMYDEQVKEMSDYGIDIASHTSNHRNLLELPPEEQIKEIKNSKAYLEKLLGKEVTSLAYPFGDYNQDSVRIAEESGYKMAFTTNRGLSDRSDKLLELDRIYISSKYSFDTFKQVLKSTKK
ncbi:MAG: polysaccharide deacetylase family protein [Clostridium sp.]